MTRALEQLAERYGVSAEALAQLPDAPGRTKQTGVAAQTERVGAASGLTGVTPGPHNSRRRRRWAASGWLPPNLAARFTCGELSALSVIASHVHRSAECRLALGAIVAIAGCSRTTAQNAIRAAQALGLLTKRERRHRGRRSETNVLTITNPEWLAWLAKRARPVGFKTPNPIRDQYKRERRTMTETVTLTLPKHAARYLAKMCERERARLLAELMATQVYDLGMDASFDSLNEIECALPDDVTRPAD